MPPKRRIRNGSYPSAAHILKPLISSSLPSAVAVAATASAAIANSAANYIHHNNSESSVANGNVLAPLTAKQQQQLERNNYLTSLTKDQLKVECRKRGQKINGNKTDLVYICITDILILLTLFFVYFRSINAYLSHFAIIFCCCYCNYLNCFLHFMYCLL